MTSVRRAIADAINERRDYGYVDEGLIRKVEVRRGCAEIDVHVKSELEPDDRDCDDVTTVPIEDVLSALLQKLIDQEQHEDAVSRLKAANDV